MSLERPQEQIEVQNAPNSPTRFIHRFRNRATSVLGAGVLATTLACSSEVNEPHPGEGGSAITPAYFDCEASGFEYSVLFDEFSIPLLHNLTTYEALDDSNSEPRILDLDYTGSAPLDQSSVYKCEFQRGDNCYVSVNPISGTAYEAAQLQSSNHPKWDTWPENGETETQTSDEMLQVGEKVLIHVVSVPASNGSYPVQISLNPECE
jgi:hypothetical protein